ncbi:Ribosomal protein S12 methylthiotransferase RimO [Candidatus Methanobinarius endosymbioticus]|uniref:Ribosomal protein S12 methylthiotransferase RimO n=1 Tax=Candidatus Methanobinarius endosymbioticus TaxID=2006182 RepID=A0A366MC92_9EURY|nr:Ribosomal protein S12 methylthiotransferase RimO [Candidatus Methanobinarius endosymbioticus]
MIYEENIIIKKPMKVDIRFGSAYPNAYKTAMSSLGYQIIYHMVNDREDSWCERIVYPNTRSIESNSPLKDFDIISFSLQYEQDYFNILEMLKQANIPINRKERKELNKQKQEKNKPAFPLIMAGGPCATANPFPINDFIDIFVVGEAEPILNKFLDQYKTLENPTQQLKSFLSIKGIYIPALNNNVDKVIVKNMVDAYHITHPIVVKTETEEDKKYLPVFGNSILLNVSRGCSRGCRFCMSGYLYRPTRETSLQTLFNVAEETRTNSGLNKITLIGAAVSDYSQINELIKGLKDRNFKVSAPSMRIESITKETLESLKESGAKTITIAPESISSFRKAINKDIDDNKIFDIVKNITELELNLKLYFLIGLPNETIEDIKVLANYIKEIDSKKKKNSIKFSVNPLIPKSHTPFQWESYDLKDFKSKIKYLKKELKGIDIKFDSAKMGFIQYVLSCKGKEIGNILETSLTQDIQMKEWKKYSKGYEFNDPLPWNKINVGLRDSFLLKERKKLYNQKSTPWCQVEPCYNCGPCNEKN